MIIGFGLLKMNAERKALEIPLNIQTQNTLRITNITEKPILSFSKEKALEITFSFRVDYLPNIANIELTGNMLYKADDKFREMILKEWEKTKKLNPTFSTQVTNHALAKCNIRALQLAQQLNLPPHIPFPRITTITKDEKPAGKKSK